jgi:hypothetical protein
MSNIILKKGGVAKLKTTKVEQPKKKFFSRK